MILGEMREMIFTFNDNVKTCIFKIGKASQWGP